ncbi:MAG: DUF2255 family protein [Planctomycetota bacterium]|jgi:hypothetical protein
MACITRLGIAIAMATALTGCFSPEDRRPGLRLRGQVTATVPSDWAFTNEHREIAIEVRTPYLLPHAVTMWCAEGEGELYVGARNPDTKRWPAWVDRDPHVRLGIGSQIFEVRLAPIEDADRIARVRDAYAAKYGMPRTPAGEGPPIRYWRVEPRST